MFRILYCFFLPRTSEGRLTSWLSYLPVLYIVNAIGSAVPAQIGQAFVFPWLSGLQRHLMCEGSRVRFPVLPTLLTERIRIMRVPNLRQLTHCGTVFTANSDWQCWSHFSIDLYGSKTGFSLPFSAMVKSTGNPRPA